ncbi:MAG: MerR family transcriptional regulator [Aaplasma endosymbiont of Hyalomma asiaticum]
MTGAETFCAVESEQSKVFLSIGDVAQEVGVEQYVLRFWETKFPQINPIKRRGRRLYGKGDVETIKKVKHMLHDLGYTIKGAQAELRKQRRCSEIVNNRGGVLAELLENMTGMRDMLVKKLGGV